MPDSDAASTARNQSVQAATAGRPALLKGFLDSARDIDVLGGTLASDQPFQASRNIATGASAPAVACILVCQAGSDGDLLDVPVLVVDGDAGWILPSGFAFEPPAITRASYKHQQRNPGVTEMVEMPGRGHALTIDSRWREVADTALAFVQRFTSPQPARTGPAGP